MSSFFERLEQRCRQVDSLLCVGLDPHVGDLAEPTAAAALAFCTALIDATSHVAAAYKPNAAFFEVFGAAGMDALRRVIEHVPAGIPVLLDAKRGDIDTTAAAYARAAFEELRADAVTLSPYMGADSISPFLQDPAKGVFVLCKTSNPSASEIQSLEVSAGGGGPEARPQRLFEYVARMAGAWGPPSRVGLVVGATDADALRAVRAAAPDVWILAPGVGAQGAAAEAVARSGVRADGLGLLVPVSRAISRAASPRDAAERVCADLRAAAAAASAAGGGGATHGRGEPGALTAAQRDFLQLAIEQGVLRFGAFSLKSGRLSPYFFNAGLFRSGAALTRLARCYASALRASALWGGFDVLFGPAYKGIPLVTALSMALSFGHGLDVPLAYNRKEAKDHGEGGVLVGAAMQGRRVLIVDDVITAGTAVREAVDLVRAAGGEPVGVIIALDRAEVSGGAEPPPSGAPRVSAVQAAAADFGLQVVAVISMRHLLAYSIETGIPQAAEIEEYRRVYGVEER